MSSERFVDFLHRRRRLLFAAWLAHAFLLHFFVLGLVSWDGLCYRLPPVLELVQHGRIGTEKFNEWAYAGYVPFVELAHVPFVYLFKLPGVLIGYPLVVFPLCVWAVHAFLRELIDDERGALLGALAYLAMPMVNQQPFAAYIDFVVIALLAAFLHALLRLRTATRPGRAFARLAGATLLFTLARAQGVYVAAVLLPVLAYAMFVERSGWRMRVTEPRRIGLAVAAAALGSTPAIAIQFWKYVTFGSPIYPMQFTLLGFKSKTGMSMEALFTFAGVRDQSPAGMLHAFVDGWLLHPTWPIGGFFDSRYMGVGLVMVLALVLSPRFVRAASRVELWLVAACVLISLVSHDFLHPRYAYALALAPTIVIARATPGLISSTRRWPFWAASILLLAHLLRPEVDVLQFRSSSYVGPRVNVTNSPIFLPGRASMTPFPDIGARIVIIEKYNFIVPMYGRGLGNQIVGTVRADALGQRCAGLAPVLAAEPAAIIVDEKNLTTDCARTCVLTTSRGKCRAFRIVPGAPAGATPGAPPAN